MASPLTQLLREEPDVRRGVEGQVLSALVDALIAEDLFGFRSRARIGSVAGALYLPTAGEERHVQVGLGPDAVVFRARPAAVAAPYRLSRPPVLLLGSGFVPNGGTGPLPLSPRELLDLVVATLAGSRPANLTEVLDGLDLAVAHGAILAAAEPGPERGGTARPTLCQWEALMALSDRPFHPVARARSGWDQARFRRYSPAAERPFGLDWVAVRRDHLEAGAPLAPEPAGMLLAPADQDALAGAARAAGVDGPDHVILPVHPWQHAHVLPDLFAAEWRDRICVRLARGLGAFRPTASTRTLVPVGNVSSVHVKLPLGISTLGALRLLPPRYLANASSAQGLLETASARHPALRGRLRACDERAWWAYSEAGYGDRPGQLGCLLRGWPEAMEAGEDLVPLGALGVTLPGGSPASPSAPGLRRLISERGGDPASPAAALDLFDDVAWVLCDVALACFGMGFMPELHGQNTVLATQRGRPRGLVLRDHDTVRVHRPWLAVAGLPDPGYDVKPGTPNSLFAGSPEELFGWFQTLGIQVALGAVVRALVDGYGVDEPALWRRLGVVLRAVLAGVDISPAAAEVASRALFRAERWPARLVLGPLLAREGTGGGSMPGGTGRAPNPLLETPAAAADPAEHAGAERLLNCYLRESGVAPVLVGSTLTVPLPRTGLTVVGSLAQRSDGGHHHYRPGFTLRNGETLRAADLARLIAAELAGEGEPGATGLPGRQDPAGFVDAVEDSVVRTRSFLASRPSDAAPDPSVAPNPFLAAEQSVRLGHPFHPAPKAAGGFSAAESARYAPEMGASFPLHWLAVAPDLLDEERLGSVRSLDPPPAIGDAAAGRLGGERAAWPLLPCHPWQARHLAGLADWSALVSGGRVVDLGPLGPPVHPTASVRTVWDPGSGRLLKLALSVRLTNFVRENPPDQLRRAVDCARVLAGLGDLARVTAAPEGGFGALLELGYRRLAPPGGPMAGALSGATGVVYREAPPLTGAGSPMVVAALLERSPLDGVPPLIRALRRAGRGDGHVAGWLDRYLELSLLPLVRLLVEAGVGLEAHTQNSLLALRDGWPARFVVRDMEGACLDRDHPLAGAGYGGAVDPMSPALCSRDEAWRRFAYFVLVNHFGQLIATLAEHQPETSEARLWHLVGARLRDESLRHGADPGAALLRDLLDGAEWPAKANLTSLLRARSEDPEWVAIPNPLLGSRRR